ncbi:MAG: 50S ribosomal protein L10 [Candidatus Peregrinibacteria bacterium]
MTVTKEQKGEILKKLTDSMKNAKSVVFADYQGLTVKDIKKLRAMLAEAGADFTVAKKTLIKLAAKEAGYGEDIPDEILEGPIGAAFSMEDEVAAANLLYKFSKGNNNLKLRGALFEGRVLSVAETKTLALLPGRDELIAKFVYLLKSPLSGFHGVLNNTISGFVRVLNAISEKQGQAA